MSQTNVRDPNTGSALSMGDAVLMANVARRFHLRGQSKSEIAGALGINRFRVARLLQAAVSTGVVRIEIGLPGSVDTALGDEVSAAFHLQHCVVLEVDESPLPALLRRLGLAAAELLGELLTRDDVLGLASARSLLGIGDGLVAFPACTVVQLTGAVSRPDALDIIQGIRDLTHVGGGAARVFYAPIVTAGQADAVRANTDVQRALELYPRISVAVVGVGEWSPGRSTIHDIVSVEDQATARREGVTSEVAGILLDDAGRPVVTDLAARTLAPSFEQLMAIPTRIAVTFGAVRAAGAATALRHGVVNGLITHRSMAVALLNHT